MLAVENHHAALVLGVAELNLDALLEEQLVERKDDVGVAGQMEAQARDRLAGKGSVALALQPDARRSGGLPAQRGARRLLHALRLVPLRRGHAERPQVHVVSGRKPARHPVHSSLGHKLRAARNPHHLGLLALRRIALALDNRHRGNRAKIARMNHAGKRFKQLRKIVVDAHVHAGRQERKALQQTGSRAGLRSAPGRAAAARQCWDTGARTPRPSGEDRSARVRSIPAVLRASAQTTSYSPLMISSTVSNFTSSRVSS